MDGEVMQKVPELVVQSIYGGPIGWRCQHNDTKSASVLRLPEEQLLDAPGVRAFGVWSPPNLLQRWGLGRTAARSAAPSGAQCEPELVNQRA